MCRDRYCTVDLDKGPSPLYCLGTPAGRTEDKFPPELRTRLNKSPLSHHTAVTVMLSGVGRITLNLHRYKDARNSIRVIWYPLIGIAWLDLCTAQTRMKGPNDAWACTNVLLVPSQRWMLRNGVLVEFHALWETSTGIDSGELRSGLMWLGTFDFNSWSLPPQVLGFLV